jgi:hypothetical protein
MFPLHPDFVLACSMYLYAEFIRKTVPQQVEVDDTIWTPESGLVTASMKLQRNALRKVYCLWLTSLRGEVFAVLYLLLSCFFDPFV